MGALEDMAGKQMIERGMMNKFKALIQSYRRKRALNNIRLGMASLGCDLSAHSDGQIEAGLVAATQALAKSGVTVEQFDRAFAQRT